MQSINFIKQTVSEKKIFKDFFFRKFSLFGAPAWADPEGGGQGVRTPMELPDYLFLPC